MPPAGADPGGGGGGGLGVSHPPMDFNRRQKKLMQQKNGLIKTMHTLCSLGMPWIGIKMAYKMSLAFSHFLPRGCTSPFHTLQVSGLIVMWPLSQLRSTISESATALLACTQAGYVIIPELNDRSTVTLGSSIQ